MSDSKKRKRNAQVALRLTEAEKARWLAACTDSGLSQSDLLMRLLEGRLVVVAGITPLLPELRRQGINLNQTVRHAHQFAPETERELLLVIKENRTCYAKIMQIIDAIAPSKED